MTNIIGPSWYTQCHSQQVEERVISRHHNHDLKEHLQHNTKATEDYTRTQQQHSGRNFNEKRSSDSDSQEKWVHLMSSPCPLIRQRLCSKVVLGNRSKHCITDTVNDHNATYTSRAVSSFQVGQLACSFTTPAININFHTIKR